MKYLITWGEGWNDNCVVAGRPKLDEILQDMLRNGDFEPDVPPSVYELTAPMSVNVETKITVTKKGK